MLNAIIPQNYANMLDTNLYTLCKQQILECGSLAKQTLQQRSQSTVDIFSQENIPGGGQRLHHQNHGGQGIYFALLYVKIIDFTVCAVSPALNERY